MRRKEAGAAREEKERVKVCISPPHSRLLEPDLLGRGATPERAEYEASALDLSAEESGLEQIDEDEWTDRNFGNSTVRT